MMFENDQGIENMNLNQDNNRNQRVHRKNHSLSYATNQVTSTTNHFQNAPTQNFGYGGGLEEINEIQEVENYSNSGHTHNRSSNKSELKSQKSESKKSGSSSNKQSSIGGTAGGATQQIKKTEYIKHVKMKQRKPIIKATTNYTNLERPEILKVS